VIRITYAVRGLRAFALATHAVIEAIGTTHYVAYHRDTKQRLTFLRFSDALAAWEAGTLYRSVDAINGLPPLQLVTPWSRTELTADLLDALAADRASG